MRGRRYDSPDPKDGRNKVQKKKNPLTKEKIVETLKEIFYRKQEERKDRKVVMAQYCKGANTWVDRGEFGLNLCNDPDCVSCRMLHRLMKEEASHFTIEGAKFTDNDE